MGSGHGLVRHVKCAPAFNPCIKAFPPSACTLRRRFRAKCNSNVLARCDNTHLIRPFLPRNVDQRSVILLISYHGMHFEPANRATVVVPTRLIPLSQMTNMDNVQSVRVTSETTWTMHSQSNHSCRHSPLK